MKIRLLINKKWEGYAGENMSFHYYFNMEPLALRIAKGHIDKMTNDNFIDGDDVFLDESKLLNNLENGFVALTQLSCYLESFLNTILNSCMKYDGENLLKCSIEEKLEIIYMHYEADLKLLKSVHYWQNYKTATRVRNEMIHYKKTSIGWGGDIPTFKIGNQDVESYFTQERMNQVYDGYISLSQRIAEDLGLSICSEMTIFTCDGRCDLVNYVYDPNSTEEWSIDYMKSLKAEGII
ncbi:MAG: hypothetical protein IKB01_04275 [Lachnospiraceae bacterium]|nr:hypothetical protein [Lachnospiraceae bacterium]